MSKGDLPGSLQAQFIDGTEASSIPEGSIQGALTPKGQPILAGGRKHQQKGM